MAKFHQFSFGCNIALNHVTLPNNTQIDGQYQGVM